MLTALPTSRDFWAVTRYRADGRDGFLARPIAPHTTAPMHMAPISELDKFKARAQNIRRC